MVDVKQDSEPAAPLLRQRTILEYFGLLLRGFLMGAADVVPGVSGGTMAFILGIYEELIESIRKVASPAFLQPLLKFRLKEALIAINAPFLVAVASGILLAVFTLAQGLEWLLHNQPVYLWSFFFGLVLASVATVSTRVSRWTPALVGGMLVAALAAYVLVGLAPRQTPNAPWFLILSGALAICAMILPGISGAFILVLLGKYQYVLGAVNERDFVTIGLVGIGAVVGLLSVAQLLGWLFKRYHDLTIALLIGLMIGSLRKIWPWKEVVAHIVDRHGEIIPTIEHNVLPAAFNGEVMIALALALLGFVAVFAMDRWANQKQEAA